MNSPDSGDEIEKVKNKRRNPKKKKKELIKLIRYCCSWIYAKKFNARLWFSRKFLNRKNSNPQNQQSTKDGNNSRNQTESDSTYPTESIESSTSDELIGAESKNKRGFWGLIIRLRGAEIRTRKGMECFFSFSTHSLFIINSSIPGGTHLLNLIPNGIWFFGRIISQWVPLLLVIPIRSNYIKLLSSDYA